VRRGLRPRCAHGLAVSWGILDALTC